MGHVGTVQCRTGGLEVQCAIIQCPLPFKVIKTKGKERKSLYGSLEPHC